MKASAPQLDRFKPEMPRIPGVDHHSSSTGGKPNTRFVIAIAGALLVGCLGWWGLYARKNGTPLSATAEAIDAAPVATANDAASLSQRGPNGFAVATVEELAKPWSAKKFTFTDPVTHASTPAMILRLPGTTGSRSSAYWAFSLNAPYASCQLDYVTDLGQLASRYAYRANHPMVVAACSGTIYDPLKVGTVPSGAWVRGDIAQGVGIRPPMSIDIRLENNSILASRME